MRVFVFLESRLDPAAWAADFDAGIVPDKSPYGYHHAIAMGCEVTLSRPRPLSRPFELVSRLLRRLLGTDVVHAMANAKRLFGENTDIVWTHTEREYLAVLLLGKTVFRASRKPIIAQSVWLIDNWASMSGLRKAFYKWLVRDADVLTFHSLSNAEVCRELGLNKRVEVVPFGISTDSFPRQAPRSAADPTRPLRLLALGNDVHRDWPTLSTAVANDAGIELRVASSTFADELRAANISAGPLNQKELRAAYDWADLVVIPLRPNLHASGITVLLEAVQLGLPVVTSDVGGLRGYFGDDAVIFVPTNDAEALRDAILAARGRDLAAMVQRAQDRLESQKFTTVGYAKHHVDLSRSILGIAAP